MTDDNNEIQTKENDSVSYNTSKLVIIKMSECKKNVKRIKNWHIATYSRVSTLSSKSKF